MLHRIVGAVVILLVLLSLAGCGLRHRYADVTADLRATGTEHVVVAAVDNRPYIVSGEKEKSFVGLMRSGAGIPFDVHTDGKKPFAQELADAACRSLTRSKFRCSSEVLPPRDSDAALTQALVRQNSSKALLFTITQWKIDTYAGTALWYEIQLAVRDRNGRTVATSAVQGKDVLGYSFIAPAIVATEEAPKTLKNKLEQLMNDTNVSAALMK